MTLFVSNIVEASLIIDGKYLMKHERNIEDENKKNLHRNMIIQNMDF
jgi:hypothetical protein